MRRRGIRLAGGILALLTLLSWPLAASADAPPQIAAPTDLVMVAPGTSHTLDAGGWINTTTLGLHFHVAASSSPVTPQVEVEPADVPFTGQPNFTGSPVDATGVATVTATGLQNGKTYHWAARVITTAGAGNSGWVNFAGVAATSTDFGVDRTPPSRPFIRSSSNPDENRWYNTSIELLRWHASDPLSGIAGYTVAIERATPHVIPPGSVTRQHAARVTNLGDGTWFLAVRAEDRAGNWSPTATYRMQLDRRPARVQWLSPPKFEYNPFEGLATVRFKVDKDAATTLALYRVGSSKPVMTFSYPLLHAGQVQTISWNGKTASGKQARKGFYFFSVQLTDHANNLTRVDLGGIFLNPRRPQKSPAGPVVYADGGKRIIVSLSRETLYAYDGDHLVLQTYVTTGNPNLPTPTGSYTTLTRQHPFEFISPWPLGSPYYYAPSWSQYAMLFRAGGYYLHDAPWRSAFGPGTDGPGQPGTNYGGTHGCVNIPPGPMLFIWNWAPLGTPVDIVS